MAPRPNWRLPQSKHDELRRARRQERATLALRVTVVIALYIGVGGSQALSAIWLKSLWALLPPVAFLAAVRIEARPPTPRFPYGFYRAGSIGFLTSALALSAMGTYLLYAGLRSLIESRPPELAPFTDAATWWAWPGWWLVAALTYSVAVPLIIGRRRQSHAVALHDKGLYADASMGRMNWRAGLVAMVGVLGIGLGAGWLDYAATLVIGADILWQGLRHLQTAVCDLMDEIPRRIASNEIDPLGQRIHDHLGDQPWVDDARVRLREEGRLLTGIALVRPTEPTVALDDLESARRAIAGLDWRLLDFQIVPVARDEFRRCCHDDR